MRLLAVDHGKHLLGWAIFEDRVLMQAGLFRFGTLHEVKLWIESIRMNQVVCEVPQIYTMGKSKADPNDLVQIALTAGVVLGACECAIQVLPRAWKGTLNADVCCKRVRDSLSPSMSEIVDKIPKTIRHNCLDAIGIGYWRCRCP